MATISEFQKTTIIDLMQFAPNMEYVYTEVTKLQTSPIGKILNIELPTSFVSDVTKGLLIFKGKNTNVSDDAIKMLLGVSLGSFSGKNNCAIDSFNTVLNTIEDGKQDKADLYRFLECAQIAMQLFEVAYAVKGDGIAIPLQAIYQMVHPQAWERIVSYQYPDQILQEAITDETNVWDLILYGENGEQIYNQLYKVLDDTFMSEKIG